MIDQYAIENIKESPFLGTKLFIPRSHAKQIVRSSLPAEIVTFVHYEKIVQTAEMLFRTQGFDNTTVRDITKRLNICDSLFYHYFKSVDEILELLWSGPPLSRDRNAKKRKSSNCHSSVGVLP